MSRLKSILRNLWFWPYDRGTWQYDIIVLLILVFIFLTPRSVFDTEEFDRKILAYGSSSSVPSGDTAEPKKDDGKGSEEGMSEY